MSKASLQYTDSLEDREEAVLIKASIWTWTRETSTLQLSEISEFSRFEWHWHFVFCFLGFFGGFTSFQKKFLFYIGV